MIRSSVKIQNLKQFDMLFVFRNFVFILYCYHQRSTLFDTFHFLLLAHAQPTLKFAGPYCLNVEEVTRGGMTHIESHCSGSCPAWIAVVANPFGKGR